MSTRVHAAAPVARGAAPGTPAHVASVAFWRGYIVTMRPYLLFVSGITGIAGLSLAPALPAAPTLLLSLVFFLSYGFGQALTDCFQLDTDSLSAPYRPLVQGAIRSRDVAAVSFAGLGACAVALALYRPSNLLLAAIAVLGLATYTPFKRRPWAGPFYNAWIVALLALIAHLAGLGAARAPFRASAALLGALAVVFFGYANFVLTGYYKDISADRATGYRTLPVAVGMRAAAVVSDLFALLALAGAGLAASAAFPETVPTTSAAAARVVGVTLLGAGACTAVLAQIRLHRVRHERQAHRAIGLVVHSYILLLAGLSALWKPGWVPALLAFYVAFVVVLWRRPMRQQI